MRTILISLALGVALSGCANQPEQTSSSYITPKGERWEISTQSNARSNKLLVNGEVVALSSFNGNLDGTAYASGLYRGQMFSFHCSPAPKRDCLVYAGGVLLSQQSLN